MSRTQAEEKALEAEKKSLAKSFMFSLVNMVVDKYSNLSSINMIPSSIAHTISEKDMTGIDALLKESHKVVSFKEEEEGISIRLCFNSLISVANKPDSNQERRKILVTYLQNGAGSLCMHDLFSISKTQIVSLRKQYNIITSSSGRQDCEELELAKRLYDELKRTPDSLKEDLLYISKEYKIPLNTVWHAVRGNKTASKSKSEKNKGLTYVK